MADDKLTLGDDEFHFSEAEESHADNPFEGVADASSSSKGSKINRRNILIAVGIVIVALAMYKLIGVFFGSSSNQKATTVTTTAKQPSSASATQSSAVQIASTAKEQSVTTHILPSALKDQLSQMQQNDSSNNQQITEINNQLSTISGAMDNLNNVLNQMNQQLHALGAQLQAQQMEIEQLRPKRATASTSTHRSSARKVAVLVPHWAVQALIPGRAWLINQEGQSISVRKGDRIPSAGTVTNISVVTGTVKTSTGAILRYKNI